MEIPDELAVPVTALCELAQSVQAIRTGVLSEARVKLCGTYFSDGVLGVHNKEFLADHFKIIIRHKKTFSP